jgi:hypothetical protein
VLKLGFYQIHFQSLTRNGLGGSGSITVSPGGAVWNIVGGDNPSSVSLISVDQLLPIPQDNTLLQIQVTSSDSQTIKLINCYLSITQLQ